MSHTDRWLVVLSQINAGIIWFTDRPAVSRSVSSWATSQSSSATE